MTNPKNQAADALNPVVADRLAHSGLPTERDKQIAMEMAMRDVIRRDMHHDVHFNATPGASDSEPTIRDTSGWRDAQPLSPPGDYRTHQLIERIANVAWPHAPGNALMKPKEK
jgi:hypothetical protein